MTNTPDKATFVAWAEQNRDSVAKSEAEFKKRDSNGLSGDESQQLAIRLTSKSAPAPLLPAGVLPMV